MSEGDKHDWMQRQMELAAKTQRALDRIMKDAGLLERLETENATLRADRDALQLALDSARTGEVVSANENEALRAELDALKAELEAATALEPHETF